MFLKSTLSGCPDYIAMIQSLSNFCSLKKDFFVLTMTSTDNFTWNLQVPVIGKRRRSSQGFFLWEVDTRAFSPEGTEQNHTFWKNVRPGLRGGRMRTKRKEKRKRDWIWNPLCLSGVQLFQATLFYGTMLLLISSAILDYQQINRNLSGRLIPVKDFFRGIMRERAAYFHGSQRWV